MHGEPKVLTMYNGVSSPVWKAPSTLSGQYGQSLSANRFLNSRYDGSSSRAHRGGRPYFSTYAHFCHKASRRLKSAK